MPFLDIEEAFNYTTFTSMSEANYNFNVFFVFGVRFLVHHLMLVIFKKIEKKSHFQKFHRL